ncbi:PEP-CTERM sorting domain-containing protein [Coraliomargarita algicola]|uniref:PEP-CTERM sorting domain-containing protein n=1 Tax=Coraliomargarita algicola TaxID=3092156 RepID=A0ABZ0RJY1_9BACT|nr:PEP-CTERM sorting domain-containing protein [Coraliomargarita sp. J2-16]WPJ95481.1 PEP-CTERM sorting domain-containing protein [Coraliomargarita sp. J2-16]
MNGGSTWLAANALTTDQTSTASQGDTTWQSLFLNTSEDSMFQGLDSVEFRIYVWGGSGTTSNSRMNFDQIVVEGTVPEPGTYALLAGCFALGSVMLRRRRA